MSITAKQSFYFISYRSFMGYGLFAYDFAHSDATRHH